MNKQWDLVFLFCYVGDGFGCARSDEDGRDSCPINGHGYFPDVGFEDGNGRGGGHQSDHNHSDGWGQGEIMPKGAP